MPVRMTPTALEPHAFGHRSEEDVDGRPMAVDQIVAEQPTSAMTGVRHLEVGGAAGREIDAAGFERRSLFAFDDARAGQPVETPSERLGERRRHVERDHRRRAIGGIVRQDRDQGLDAARRSADRDDPAVRPVGRFALEALSARLCGRAAQSSARLCMRAAAAAFTLAGQIVEGIRDARSTVCRRSRRRRAPSLGSWRSPPGPSGWRP